MGFNRYDKRVDRNQQSIVDAARAEGCAVYVLSRPVDLLVSIAGINCLWEIKGESGDYTDDQVRFRRAWPTGFCTIRSAEEAKEEIGRVRALASAIASGETASHAALLGIRLDP